MTSNRILELIKRVLIHKCRCIYKRYKIRRLFGTRRPRSGMCFYGLVAAQPPHHHGLVGPTLKRGTFLPGYIVLNMVKTRILVESAFTARLFFLENNNRIQNNNFLIQNNNITPPVFGWSINIIIFLSNPIMELIHWKKLLKYKIIHSGKGFFGNLPSIKGRYYSRASYPECLTLNFY